MADSSYQAIIIGAGPGGYPCAIRLAQLGVKTLIIERDNWGGVCANVGCIPSKALIHASKRLDEIKHASDFGIEVGGDVTLNMQKLQAWKQKVIGRLTGGIETLLKGNKVDRVLGDATLTGPKQVTVNTADGQQVFKGEHIVLATGSSPIEIPGFSFSDPHILSSTGALALDTVPDHLLVIGGGYIGLELGGMYAGLGAKVTIVEFMDSLLPGFDPDVVKLLTRRFKKRGVKMHLKSKATGWEATDDGVCVHIDTPKGPQSIDADAVLVTVGRTPNTAGLGLKKLGVKMDGHFIKVDPQRRTNVPSIFAIGDVAGQPMLAHKATAEGEVVAEVIAGHNVIYDPRTVPAVVFTDPEVAQAGIDEAAARAKGPVKIGKVPFAAIGKALTNNATDGFIKVIVDAEDHRVLGVTIVGQHASDLISEASLAIEMDAEALDLGLTIHPHPTLGEGIMEAAKAALGEAIHILG